MVRGSDGANDLERIFHDMDLSANLWKVPYISVFSMGVKGPTFRLDMIFLAVIPFAAVDSTGRSSLLRLFLVRLVPILADFLS
jgi:hypothetical protein